MTHAPASVPTIADLWRSLRAWLADALRDLRGPVAVAQLLTRAAQDAVQRRLRLIESLLMKLLLIEAAQFGGPPAARRSLHPFPGRRGAASPGPIDATVRNARRNTPCASSHLSAFMGPGLGAARQSGNGCGNEDANDSATWRVRFRLRLRDLMQRKPRRAAMRAFRPACTNATPETRAQTRARKLARRLEALRRTIADPRRAIAALARRLRTSGALARAIALSRPRSAGASLPLAHAIVCASDMSAGFDDSS